MSVFILLLFSVFWLIFLGASLLGRLFRISCFVSFFGGYVRCRTGIFLLGVISFGLRFLFQKVRKPFNVICEKIKKWLFNRSHSQEP